MHEELKTLIRAQPMRPFRIHLKSGEAFDILRPGFAGTAKNFFMVNDKGEGRRFSYDQIDRLERLETQGVDSQ